MAIADWTRGGHLPQAGPIRISLPGNWSRGRVFGPASIVAVLHSDSPQTPVVKVDRINWSLFFLDPGSLVSLLLVTYSGILPLNSTSG